MATQAAEERQRRLATLARLRSHGLALAHAAQPEIVRANQKDLYYLGALAEQVDDVARTLLGPRALHAYSAQLALASRVAYFALTTLVGAQTLGEEYVELVQATARTSLPPSLLRRLTLVAMHTLAPYVLARALFNLRRRSQAWLRSPPPADSDGDDRSQDASLLTRARRRTLGRLARVLAVLPPFERIRDDHVRAVHLALFYLFGRYYHLSKRLTGIRYLSMRAENDAQGSGPVSYEVLGVLMALQLAVRATLSAKRRLAPRASDTSAHSRGGPDTIVSEDEASESDKGVRQARRRRRRRAVLRLDGHPVRQRTFDPDDPDAQSAYDAQAQREDDERRRCPLCLGPRRDQCATECGHVFCWECIVGWACEKAECPLCRQGVNLSKLVPLHNY